MSLLKAGSMALAVLLLFIGGCKENLEPVTSQGPLAESDIADIVAVALGGSQSSAGLTAQIEEAAIVAGGGSIGKVAVTGGTAGEALDTLTIRRTRSGEFSYDYTFWYSYSFIGLNTLQFSFSMRGVYDTPRLSSSDSASAVITATNILTGQTYTVDGTYFRLGTQVVKRSNFGFRSTIMTTLTQIQVDKVTRQISSGSARFNISGETAGGITFTWEALVTFSGNGSATMLVGKKTYMVDLVTGQASEKQ